MLCVQSKAFLIRNTLPSLEHIPQHSLSAFFSLVQYAHQKLGQPPARFWLNYNARGFYARRRQSSFLLKCFLFWLDCELCPR